MDLVHVESTGGLMRLRVSQDMWFYLAMTAPLMAITIFGWLFWEFMIQRRLRVRAQEQHDEERVKNV